MNKGVYFAGFTTLLMGFLAIAIKVSLNTVLPMTVAWFRFALAFAVLFTYYLIFDKSKIKILKKPPIFAMLAAASLSVNYAGYIFGINLTTPSIAQIFIQVGPVILAVAGFVIFKERVSIRQSLGLFVVIIGLVIFYNEQILNIAGGLKDYMLGVGFILIAGLAWASYGVFQKFAIKAHNPMQLNLIIFGLPVIILSPFVSFDEYIGLSLNDWLLLIFLGLNTLGAYGSLAYALKYIEANKISVILAINPLITLSTMALLSKQKVSWIEPEIFTTLTIVGALTVLLGVVLTVMKKKKKLAMK